ncbi:MAG: cytochrome c [Bacteroidota bacterium]
MSTKLKRIFFWSLFLLFIAYGFFIYTSGTENDGGKRFLTEGAKRGKLLFQEYNCTSCHQLYGLGGYMGPDLTNVISAPGKGESYVKSFIKNGTQQMPNFHLGEADVNALTEYLNYVDKTGISPVRNFEVQYDGTIMQKAIQ